MDKRGNLHLNGGLVPPLGFFDADPSLVSAMAASVRALIVLVPGVKELPSPQAEVQAQFSEPIPIPARPSSPSPAAEPRGMRVNRRGRK